ncbi:MAG: alpha/beta hydrolase [Hymenobacter sp.]
MLERQLDYAIKQKDIETFILCGHSMGGIVALSAMDRFWERRTDLLDRITGVTLANSTAVTNVLQDSVVDRAPGVPEVLKAGVNIFGRMMVPAASAAKAGYRALPSAVAERVSPYTPDKGAKLFFSGSYIENMLGHMSGPVITASAIALSRMMGW